MRHRLLGLFIVAFLVTCFCSTSEPKGSSDIEDDAIEPPLDASRASQIDLVNFLCCSIRNNEMHFTSESLILRLTLASPLDNVQFMRGLLHEGRYVLLSVVSWTLESLTGEQRIVDKCEFWILDFLRVRFNVPRSVDRAPEMPVSGMHKFFFEADILNSEKFQRINSYSAPQVSLDGLLHKSKCSPLVPLCTSGLTAEKISSSHLAADLDDISSVNGEKVDHECSSLDDAGLRKSKISPSLLFHYGTIDLESPLVEGCILCEHHSVYIMKPVVNLGSSTVTKESSTRIIMILERSIEKVFRNMIRKQSMNTIVRKHLMVPDLKPVFPAGGIEIHVVILLSFMASLLGVVVFQNFRLV